jgi:hypothetical protein
MSASRPISLALLGALLALAPTTTARADVQVIESSVPDIMIGARFPDDWRPDLRPGAFVRVLLPSNQTRTFSGPEPSSPVGAAREMTQDNE